MSAGKKTQRIKQGSSLLLDFVKQDLKQNKPAPALGVEVAPSPTAEAKIPLEAESIENVEVLLDDANGVGMSEYHYKLHRDTISQAADRQTRFRVDSDEFNPQAQGDGWTQFSSGNYMPQESEYSILQSYYSPPYSPSTQYFSPPASTLIAAPHSPVVAPIPYAYYPQYHPYPRHSSHHSPPPPPPPHYTYSPSPYHLSPPHYHMSPSPYHLSPPHYHMSPSPYHLSPPPYTVHTAGPSMQRTVVVPPMQHQQQYHHPAARFNPAARVRPLYATNYHARPVHTHTSPRHHMDLRAAPRVDLGPRVRPVAVNLPHGSMSAGGDDLPSTTKKAGKKKKQNKAKNRLSMGDISGNALELVCKRDEGRALQELMKEDPVIADLVYREVRSQLVYIMMHEYGNYSFQVLYKVSSADRQLSIIEAVRDHLHASCQNRFGSRAVQEIASDCHADPLQSRLIVEALSSDVRALCLDERANHIVQYCLKHFDPSLTQGMFEVIAADCVAISKEKFGNRVIQTCFECLPADRKGVLFEAINGNVLDLITDEFGNYIIQAVLEHSPSHVDDICRAVVGNMTSLSMDKHASRVMEKCFEQGSNEVLARYVQEMTDPENTVLMINDEFGNYVLQSALKTLPPDLHYILASSLRDHVSDIQQTSWGLQIIAKICN